MDGQELASATLGLAEVHERQPLEHLVARLSWQDGELAAARAVVSAAAAAVPPDEPVHLLTMLPTSERVLTTRLGLAEDCGFTLFQEKEGFWWADEGQRLPPPERVDIRPMTSPDRGELESVLGRCVRETLDRADRAMLARGGAGNWVTAFLDHSGAQTPEPTWLLARDPDGSAVGYAGLVDRGGDNRVGTIAHIGVVPERRGRRYSDDLLRAAHLAARGRGWDALLSHVDVENRPVLAAMTRAGVRAEAHPWHKRHHRRLTGPR